MLDYAGERNFRRRIIHDRISLKVGHIQNLRLKTKRAVFQRSVAIIEKSVRYIIGYGDKQHRNHRFEDADCRRRAVLGVFQTKAVNHGINNVARFIHDGAVHVVDLIEAGVEHVAKAQHHHQHDDHAHTGQCDVPGLLPAVRAVNGGRFVQRGIDAGNGGHINDGAVAEVLPDVRPNDGLLEVFVIA